MESVEAQALSGNAELRDFMDRLTADTTVSKYVELPMICVMGDTSSGKSSLLSQISMVELPSSSELTTKCPIMLQMTQSTVSRATVCVQVASLDDAGGSNGAAANTATTATTVLSTTTNGGDPTSDNNYSINGKNNQFEPLELTDLSKLPAAILDAQDFVLQHTHKQVASDVIQVHVFGPHCMDLTLVDLPGMAQARGTEESESLVPDLTHLIQTYLSNPRCVILAVLSANVDFHNSQILALAQTVDPDSKRTIPVITKPDLIDPGAEQSVLDLLLGKKINLGFQMCKGRGQAALDDGQSLPDSLQGEIDFFDTQEPWKSVSDRTLFGTVPLRQKLGDLQMTMIRETIPAILKEIHEKQQHAFTILVGMGNLHQTAAEKRRYYQDYCQSFVGNLNASLSGKGQKAKQQPSAAAKLHDACAAFMQSIREGSLGTIKAVVEGAQVLVTSAKGDVRGEVVHVAKDYACVDYVDEKDHTVDVLFDYVGYKAQETLEEDDVWSDGSKVYIARKNNTFDLLTLIPINRIRTDPSWLQEKISENRTDDLACFLNVDIFKSIVADFIEQDWRPHCSTLINQTSDIVLAAVSGSLLVKSSEVERFPKLHALIQLQSSRAARALLVKAEKQVEAHLMMEEHPYTQDQVLFESIAAARHRSLKREMEVALRLDQEGAVYDTAAIKAIMEGVFDRNRRKSVEQHLAEDMEIVLESYGTVATKRVIDRSPMICWEVFRSLVPSIQDTLWNITDAQLEDCMRDSDDFSQQYKDLTEELEQMNKALTIFQSIV
eukprot:CAMPEP_0119011730 /NCGR_PEP_ID=MMETSP1176-20130426/5852_1 /TAXON_ID=265551 /ORGANISM="Synedropsis recta cf, Strain CCMP1620" /LENGTH=777 /DNA_ID=CAMNT_0006964587 /DNA_START=314 /DNA_END=2647 /DNA_ORIENTATION=+